MYKIGAWVGLTALKLQLSSLTSHDLLDQEAVAA